MSSFDNKGAVLDLWDKPEGGGGSAMYFWLYIDYFFGGGQYKLGGWEAPRGVELLDKSSTAGVSINDDTMSSNDDRMLNTDYGTMSSIDDTVSSTDDTISNTYETMSSKDDMISSKGWSDVNHSDSVKEAENN